jgi:HAMP domain-containing protein
MRQLLQRERGRGRRVSPGQSTLLPELLVVASTLVLVWFFRRVLADAQRSDIELTTLVPLFLAMTGLALAAGLLVVGQASRSAKRLQGPAQRLILAMQRTQRGDLAHRVHLRHGDDLKEVAAEFNRLLDWLNANPPVGATTGTDLVDVDALERLAALEGDEGDLEGGVEAGADRVGAASDD